MRNVKRALWLVLFIGLIYTIWLVADKARDKRHGDGATRAREELVVEAPRQALRINRYGAALQQATGVERKGPESIRFVASRTCSFALSARGEMQNVLLIYDQNKGQPRNAESKDYLDWCQARAVQFAREMTLVERDLRECPTMDLQEANEKFFEDAARAALAGDPDAQACYLRAAQFALDRPWSAEEIEDYKVAGPVLVQQGLERGDWRTIELLSKATPGRPGRLVPMHASCCAF